MSARAFIGDPVFSSHLNRLPLVTLYLTERCNSRCVTCDYWRHGRADMSFDAVKRLLPNLAGLKTRVVLLSGGEPLLNPEWECIAHALRDSGVKVWLLTSGLSLAKYVKRAAEVFDTITVSLDGTDRQTYQAIRGLDALDKVCEGIRAAAAHGVAPGLRVTLQRENFRQLRSFVTLAKELGARQVSFLAVDVANPHAFARTDGFVSNLALLPDELHEFDELLNDLERECAADFRSGFIAESPAKLRRMLQYFGALLGKAPYPEVRCNAPEFSAVIGAAGRVQPCFFIPGPAQASLQGDGAALDDLARTLNGERMRALRGSIRVGARAECKTCVCSMWRDPPSFGSEALQ